MKMGIQLWNAMKNKAGFSPQRTLPSAEADIPSESAPEQTLIAHFKCPVELLAQQALPNGNDQLSAQELYDLTTSTLTVSKLLLNELGFHT